MKSPLRGGSKARQGPESSFSPFRAEPLTFQCPRACGQAPALPAHRLWLALAVLPAAPEPADSPHRVAARQSGASCRPRGGNTSGLRSSWGAPWGGAWW